MDDLTVQDVQVLVIANPSDKDAAGTRGRLLERFVASLLSDCFGYEPPTTSNLNVTADGIELDVRTTDRLTRRPAIAECKAYSRNVAAKEITNFYGKVTVARLDDHDVVGVMCVLPRLTPQGEEVARRIAASDPSFRYLSASAVATALRQYGFVATSPCAHLTTSDEAIVITEDGVFGGCLILDPVTKTANSVAVWGKSSPVPHPTIAALGASDYAAGQPVIDMSHGFHQVAATAGAPSREDLLVTVSGSTTDFEYQLPAGPKVFVGREKLIKSLQSDLLRNGSIVLNGKSGWGKSSLALKLQDVVRHGGGHASVFDARTATQPRYVVDVLRKVANEAAASGFLKLPADASWGSLASAVKTLTEATWLKPKPMVIFFDQFENVFRDPELTRAFRDLALAVRDIPGPLTIGFAWKVDFVGWTENHPYQLRDEIRSASKVENLTQLNAAEVGVVLRRLEKAVGAKLHPDLRSRLRTYSQGLPWLLKKLCDHVYRELQNGSTQDDLLAASLNVKQLFESDLAELSAHHHEALRYVARRAPIPASEVTERFDAAVVQSLVDRRLLVQVGEQLDTYWDTFRDFLNTGDVPIQDSYVLRESPGSFARLLSRVVAQGGSSSVPDLAREFKSGDTYIFNLSRDLRLLGVVAYEPNKVTLVPEILQAPDSEAEFRRRVGSALKRHTAYAVFEALAEQQPGVAVTATALAAELPVAFSGFTATTDAWFRYARAFLFWFDYAGLAIQRGPGYLATPNVTSAPTLRLLDGPSAFRTRPAIPQIAPSRPVELLRSLSLGDTVHLQDGAKSRETVRTLHALGAVRVAPDQQLHLTVDMTDFTRALRQLLEGVPGGREGLEFLRSDGSASPQSVGDFLRDHLDAGWADGTTRHIGGHFRAWARLAGISITPVARRRATSQSA